MCPLSGRSSPARQRSRVVLPDPEGLHSSIVSFPREKLVFKVKRGNCLVIETSNIMSYHIPLKGWPGITITLFIVVLLANELIRKVNLILLNQAKAVRCKYILPSWR